MATKKYVSLEKLGLYDEKIKKVISDSDAATLASAVAAAEALGSNYDAAGAAATAEANAIAAAKTETTTQVNALRDGAVKDNADAITAIKDGSTIDSFADVEAALAGKQDNGDYATKDEAQGYADAKDEAIAEAKAAADAAQEDVDNLAAYVGTFTASEGVDTVVKYIDAKTANIASDETVNALAGRVTQAEKDIDAIEADYLKATDKEGLQSQITANANAISAMDTAYKAADVTLQQNIDAKVSQTDYDAKVAELVGDIADNTKAISDMDTAYKAADTAFDGRISTLEGQITGLTGAMHFKGVVTTDPTTITEGYDNGDVVVYGEKEYVWNNGAFVLFGDVSAEGERISTLEGKVTTLEGEMDAVEGRATTLEGAVATKAEQSALDTEIENRTNADTALSGRIDTLESAIGTSGSVANDIAAAKQEAIDAAATDAANKDVVVLSEAQSYADGLNTAMAERVDALEAIDHEHSNKALLDTYTQTEANLADAVAKKHEHSNLTVLEGITSAKVTAWDNAESNAKTYTDGEIDKVEATITTLTETVNGKASASDLTALTTRVTTAEGEIDTLQTEMDAVEAKAGANETAISGLQTTVASKASQADLDAAVLRIAANETAIASFVEVSEQEILDLFK